MVDWKIHRVLNNSCVAHWLAARSELVKHRDARVQNLGGGLNCLYPDMVCGGRFHSWQVTNMVSSQ